MKNPIPKTGFVATPDSLENLMEYCERFSGQEKAIAVLTATMALNLAHKLVEATQGETNEEGDQ
jgi:dTDP-4-amino-4,6-dideoxygalactose transaminase